MPSSDRISHDQFPKNGAKTQYNPGITPDGSSLPPSHNPAPSLRPTTKNVFASLQEMFLQGREKAGVTFRPPQNSVSTRNFHSRSTFSNRGEIIAHRVDRVIRLESHLEYKVALTFLASANVADLAEQPPARSFIDASGKSFAHTFDFLVTFNDGRRFYLYVKPWAIVQKRSLQSILKLMTEQLDQRDADGILLVTDRDINPVALHNAELLQAGLNSNKPDVEAQLDQICSTLKSAIAIKDLAEMCGGARIAFRTVVRFIALRKLFPLEKGRIEPTSLVSVSASEAV